jgi:uncharacterized protein
MYVERLLTDRLLRLVDHFTVVVVTGARQVGKSTLLEHALGDRMDAVTFDPVVDVENARADPDLFLDNREPPLILDEIQYAPELVPALKRRVDRNRAAGRYVITGSQQWGVLRSIAESLAGRAVLLDLDSFSLAEINGRGRNSPWFASWLESPEEFLATDPTGLDRDRTMYEQIWRGFLPEAQTLPLDVVPDFHASYLRTYVERDIRLMGEVSDWQLFGRFTRLLGALTAQEINHSQLGRELGITHQTAGRWLDLMQAAFQWYEIPAYSGNAVKRVSGRGKGFLADTGLACAGQAIASPHAIGGHPIQGALFETAVVAEIRKQVSWMSPKPNLYHWRSHGGAEVDLVLEYNGALYPVEIKSTTKPSRRDTTGMTAFRRTYPGARVQPGLVLAPIERTTRLSERDWAVPWDLAPSVAVSGRAT